MGCERVGWPASLSRATQPTALRSGSVGVLLARVVTSLILIPLFVWLVIRAHGWYFAALVCGVATLALWELLRLFEQAGQPGYRRLGLVLGGALIASFEVGHPAVSGPFTLPALVLGAAAGIVLSAPVFERRASSQAPATTLLALVYVSWLLGHALLLHRSPVGDQLVLLLVGVTWVGETAAYAVGSTLGRRRLAPEISPAKTIEGAIAQFVASVVAALALGTWLLPDWSPWRFAGAGVLLGVSGQLGDLAESAIKRSAGVKDAGGLLPGHGGILDRIDGLLFNAPALYYYLRIGGWQ